MPTVHAISSVVEGNKRVVGIGRDTSALVGYKMRVVAVGAMAVVVLGNCSCVLLLPTYKTVTMPL